MVSAIGEFRCCPHMLCKQICDPAAWTWIWLSTHTFSLSASQVRLLLILCWRLIQLGSQTVLRLIFKGKQPSPGIAFIGRNPCLWKHPCGQKPTAFLISPQNPCGPFWDPCEHSGRPIFARLLFLTFWGPKRVSSLSYWFAPISIALRPSRPASKPALTSFCSNFHGLATLEFKTCIEACLQLCFTYNFWFAAISITLKPRGLPWGRPFAPAAA